MGVVQFLMLQELSSVGSQDVDGMQAHSQLWACAPGQSANDLGVHPPDVSGVGAYSGFQVWEPRA